MYNHNLQYGIMSAMKPRASCNHGPKGKEKGTHSLC